MKDYWDTRGGQVYGRWLRLGQPDTYIVVVAVLVRKELYMIFALWMKHLLVNVGVYLQPLL